MKVFLHLGGSWHKIRILLILHGRQEWQRIPSLFNKIHRWLYNLNEKMITVFHSFANRKVFILEVCILFHAFAGSVV
jgi:hypothetical protein